MFGLLNLRLCAFSAFARARAVERIVILSGLVENAVERKPGSDARRYGEVLISRE